MDEARRFLRYLIPGLLFGVETLIMLVVVFPEWTISYLTSIKGNEGLGIALGSLLTAGGLGFLFSTIHHCCHWRLPLDSKVIDHSSMIKCLVDLKVITLDHEAGSSSVDRKMALDVTLALWYSRLKAGTPIGDADRKVTSLSDISHAAGTGRVASLVALVTVLIICMTAGSWSLDVEPILRFIFMLLLGVGLIVLFHETYVRTGGITQRLIDQLLKATLLKERTANAHGDISEKASGKASPQSV